MMVIERAQALFSPAWRPKANNTAQSNALPLQPKESVEYRAREYDAGVGYQYIHNSCESY
jgi:hypothetical protein